MAQVVQDGEDAQGTPLHLRIEEAVDHRQAVAEQIRQGHRHQIAGPAVSRGKAVLDQVGPHGRVLDHGDIVGPAHVGHAAAGVARGEIVLEQVVLFEGGLGLDQVARQVGVAGQDLALGPAGAEFGDRDAHRQAGVAALASRAIGDVLAAAETGVGQLVIDVSAVRKG